MSRYTTPIAIALLFAALLPEAAAACSVCYGGEEESRSAFILTTVLLSVLPLAMIGSLVWWIARRVRAIEAADAVIAPPSPLGLETSRSIG
jgi:hypothetical protein